MRPENGSVCRFLINNSIKVDKDNEITPKTVSGDLIGDRSTKLVQKIVLNLNTKCFPIQLLP